MEPRVIRTILGIALCLCGLSRTWNGYSQTPGSGEDRFDPYAPDKVLSFADHLRRSGRCSDAIPEYHRYLFGAVDSAGVSDAEFQIGRCHVLLGGASEAAGHFERSADNATSVTRRDSARFALAGAYLAAGLVEEFDYVRERYRLEGSISSEILRQRLVELTILRHLLVKNVVEARAIALRSFPDHEEHPVDDPLISLMLEGEQLVHRSPALAGVLSGVLPGLGKAYAGRTSDGLVSLVVIGTNSWLARKRFKEHGASSMSGWFFSLLGFTFYAGNIYGSIQAARLANDEATGRYLDEVRAELGVRIRL